MVFLNLLSEFHLYNLLIDFFLNNSVMLIWSISSAPSTDFGWCITYLWFFYQYFLMTLDMIWLCFSRAFSAHHLNMVSSTRRFTTVYYSKYIGFYSFKYLSFYHLAGPYLHCTWISHLWVVILVFSFLLYIFAIPYDIGIMLLSFRWPDISSMTRYCFLYEYTCANMFLI